MDRIQRELAKSQRPDYSRPVIDMWMFAPTRIIDAASNNINAAMYGKRQDAMNKIGDQQLLDTTPETFRGKLIQLLTFNHLYHLEHHMYPAVPHHHWKTLAQRLDPYFKNEGIKS